MDTMDILLGGELPKIKSKQFKQKRLSAEYNAPVIFDLQGVGFNRAAEIKEIENGDAPIHLLLAGVVSPNFKDDRLLDKYGAATPADLVKKMLYPGEIDDIVREIEKLSGYRTATLEEIKKK